MGDASKFTELNYKNGGIATFGNNNVSHVIGKGTIGKNGTIIENGFLIKGL